MTTLSSNASKTALSPSRTLLTTNATCSSLFAKVGSAVAAGAAAVPPAGIGGLSAVPLFIFIIKAFDLPDITLSVMVFIILLSPSRILFTI